MTTEKTPRELTGFAAIDHAVNSGTEGWRGNVWLDTAARE